MTTPMRFEHDLPRLLDELYVSGAPDYRDDLVRRIAATRQRSAWTFPERWLPMDVATQAVPTPRLPWRQLGVLALLGVLVALAIIGYVGSRPRLPDPYGPAVNGPLLYAAEGDIFIRDTVSATPRAIVSRPANDIAALFSPRGDRLLVIEALEDGEQLWVGGPDGSDLIRLGDGPFRQGHWLEFSPDGSLLAVEHAPAGIPRVELFPTDGGPSRRLTDRPAMSPTFRPPDGRQLLMRIQEAGTWGFYLVDVDGGEPVRLAIDGDRLEGGGWDLNYPVWSPTGDRLAFHTLVELPESEGKTNGFRMRVASVAPDGAVTGIEPIEVDPRSDDEMNPVFSQDGRSLFFQMRYGLLGQSSYTDSAWTFSLDTGQARPLGIATSNGSGFFVSVAPDDTSILVHLGAEREDWLVDRSTFAITRTDLGTSEGAMWQRRSR